MLQAVVVAQVLTVASLLLGPPQTAGESDIPVPASETVPLQLDPAEAPPRADPLPPEPPPPAPPPEPAIAPEGPAPALTPIPDPGGERLGCRGSRSCVRLAASGIGFGSVALGAIVAGAVLYLRPDEVIADEPAYVESTRPPGVVLMTIGTGVAMSSALLLVAAYRGSRERARGRAASLRLRGAEVAF